MTLPLAFWLFVVFALVVYVLMARGNPTEAEERRQIEEEVARQRQAVVRQRAAASRAASPTRLRTAPRRPAPRTTPAKRPRARRTRKRPFFWWLFGKK
jgi:hypothetical protein